MADTARFGRVNIDAIPWVDFIDPHDRVHGSRVKPIGDATTGPWMMYVQFPPNFSAPVHWHPFDTIYIITRGEMRIGDEGSYRAGDVRWVRGGHSYGPEDAGPEGVEFHIISTGGPIDLIYSDLVAPPARPGDSAR